MAGMAELHNLDMRVWIDYYAPFLIFHKNDSNKKKEIDTYTWIFRTTSVIGSFW